MERRPRRLGVWLLVAVSFAASALYVGWRAAAPSDGGVVPFYGDSWTADGVAVQPAPGNASLRPGDVVTGIAGRSLSSWIDGAMDPTLDRSPLGASTILYSIVRAGSQLELAVSWSRHDILAAIADNWSNLVFAAVMFAVSMFVLWRRPELSASVALVVAACGIGGSILPWLLGIQPGDIALGWPFLLYVLSANVIYMLLWPAGALHLPLAVAGRPSPRTLVLVYGVPLGAYVVLLVAGRITTPTATAWLGTWPTAQLSVVVPTVVVGLALALRAYRLASAAARRQLRWATLGALVATLVGLGLFFVPELLTGRPFIPWSAVGLLGLPLPIGIAIGVVRHGLFDIEAVVNRTLVYGGVTAAILVVYASTVLLIGAILPRAEGFPASLVATGLAALVALPVRDRLQRQVNRLMYGDRDDPYRALARLAHRLESTIEPVAIPSAVVESVAEAMRLPYVALEIGPADAVEMQASRGRPVEDPLEIPLVYGAEQVGRLLLAPRAPGEAFSPTDTRLLDDLARSAGAAVHSVRLTLDVIRSRERLVAAREEERRRIRRDLHDGLGPTLAAIGMRAELAAELAGRDSGAAEEVLTQLSSDVSTALADIRKLVDGLRPPALDELGLVGAIQAQAERLGPEPRFEVRAETALSDLPAAVEVAAYRIAVEAMTNATRHAGARWGDVVLRVVPANQHTIDGQHALQVVISDDGHGLPEVVPHGIGIASMRERAAEIGGSLEIERGPSGGTLVRARLPLVFAGK